MTTSFLIYCYRRHSCLTNQRAQRGMQARIEPVGPRSHPRMARPGED